MLRLNDLELKKGDSVFFYRHWIGITESPIYFYIQEYSIENIGKSGITLRLGSKKIRISHEKQLLIAPNKQDAIDKCKDYVANFIAKNISYLRESAKNSNDISYVNIIDSKISDLINAKTPIMINPYTSEGNIEIINN